MATSLLSACDLNKPNLPGFVLVREDCNADGSFLITSIVGQRLKTPNAAVILVCLHHNAQHYLSAGMRLGFNLSMARDRGNLILIEPLADLAENVLSSSYLATSNGDALNLLSQQIQRSIDTALKTKENCTIVLDDVTTLITLGHKELSVLRFCQRIVEHKSDQTNVLLKVNLSELHELLVKNLEGLADVEIRVTKMKSGNFKEVDGKILCYHRSQNDCNRNEKQILYKINDRNIKTFQPGEIGVRV